MNIVYVGAFRLPNYDAGASRVLNNAKLFKHIGHSVEFISWGGNYRHLDLCDDGLYRVNDSIYTITNELQSNGPFYSRLVSKLQRGRKSMKYLKNLSYTPELIIMYNADLFFSLRLILYCKIHGIRLANDINEWFSNSELHFPDMIFNKINMQFVQNIVKNKIVISSFFNSYYKGNNLYLPPLFDFEDDKWSRFSHISNIPNFDGKTLIYAGTPYGKDCIELVVETINICNSRIRLLVLGITEQEYTKRINKKFINKGNIFFIGRVSQEMVPSYYQIADFMILLRKPNRKTTAGFPTKFMEAFASGIPVLSNLTSDISNFLIDGITGFIIKNTNSESLQDVLHRIAGLKQQEIQQLKKRVLDYRRRFEYHYYATNAKRFISHLL